MVGTRVIMQPASLRVANANPEPLGKRIHAGIWVVFVGLALLLSGRPLYIAPDDWNYVAYFEGARWLDIGAFDVWYVSFLEEPLWRLYASQIGELIGAEGALRLTIFVSTLMFLYTANKIGRGTWLFIVLFFVLSDAMAVQMYYNQIRQGLALSIFLVTVVAGGGIILGALLASGIHASFLVVLPCAFVAVLARDRRYIVPLALLATIVLTIVLSKFLGDVDLGRRAETYELTRALNKNYYIVVLLQLSVVFYLTRPRVGDRDGKLWFSFTLMLAATALSLSFIHEAATRVMYVVNALIAIVLARNLLKRREFIAAIFWLSTIVAIQINEGLKVGSSEDTWLGRWLLILN